MKRSQENGRVTALVKGLSTRKEHDVIKLNVVYLINLAVSFGVMIMFWVQYISPAFHVGWRRSLVCLILGTIYALYKEIKRWLGQHEENRLGGLWVLSWWASYATMELLSFIWLESRPVPTEHFLLTLTVTLNYLLTRLSKCLYIRKKTTRRKR